VVLDMAASPGGKTTHLAARLADRNVIVANDSSASRLTALRLVLRNWGATNVGVTCYPGQQFGEMCPGLFDAVLLDAPCSMQGLRSTESHPMRAITAREQGGLALRQQRLLESAVLATRPGGQIVYSTCTLSPEEDEGVVDAVLKTFGSTLQLDDISSAMPAGAQGIVQDRDVVYSDAVKRSARLWPHIFGTAGFFAARFTRLAGQAGVPNSESNRGRSNRFNPLPGRQLDGLFQQWQEQYSFGLAEVLEKYQLAVVQFGRDLYAAPHWLIGSGSFLSYTSAGLPLAEQTPEGYLPAHDWMARFESSFKSPRYLLPDEQVDPWLRGSDLPGTPHGQFMARQVVIVSDSRGRYLGLAKILKDRLKNMLPRRLAGGW
jgi:16S rRNA (cytosine1407-C5)-methyltransferase